MIGEPQTLPLKSFKSGWVTRLPETDIPDDAFSDVQNIELNDKFLPTKCNGHQKYNAAGMAAAPVRGGALYVQTDGTKRYVFACGGKLYYSIAGSGTFTALQIDGSDLTLDADSDVEILQYQDALWIVNGKYPIITNGGYSTSKMIKVLGTTPTAVSPAGLPQGGKFLVLHQERIFVLGSIDEPDGIYWCEPFDPTDWTPDYGINYDFVGKDDGEIISGGISYQGYLYIGKPRNIYRYITLGDITEWQSRRVDTRLGWLAHRTIKEFYGHVMYLSPEGAVLFDGNNAVLVSEAIRDKMLELPQFQTNLRQWLQTTTADFTTGTVPDTTDISDNEVKPKLIPAFQPLIDTTTAEFDAGEIKTRIDTSDDELKVKIDTETVIEEYTTSGQFVNESGYAIAQSFQLDQDAYIRRVSTYNPQSWTGTRTIYLKKDNSNWPGTNIVSKSTYVGTGWTSFDFGEDIFLKANTRYWIYLDNGLYWGRDTSGTYAKGNAWSALDGLRTGHDLPFKIHGEDGDNSIFVSEEHDSTCAENGYGWGAFATSRNIPIGASIVVEVGTYDNSGTNWADIPGAQTQVINSGSTPTIARKQYIKWRAVMVPPEGKVDAFKITDVTVNPFTTGTLDYKYALTSLGHLAADETNIWFYTATADSDLSEAAWMTAGWFALGGGNSIDSTIKRYMRVRWILGSGATLTNIMVGTEFLSIKKDLGVVPTTWGAFESAYTLPGGQTLTFWMRSATTEGGLDSESWTQQTPGALVTVALRQWVQVVLRLDTDDITAIPKVDSFRINYYVGVSILQPCAVVWKGNYWLNITSVGQTTNDAIFFYNKDGGYWLKRSNKKNNIYFIDEDKLISGTSESDGFVRLNDSSNKDDTAEIDSYFITKNFELVPLVKLFLNLLITSASVVSWTFSYSVDGAAYTDITIDAASPVRTFKKVFSGIVSGRFIKLRVRQASEDAQFVFHGLGLRWRGVTELNVSE